MDLHTIGLILIAVFNLVTAFLTLRTQKDVKKVELATNSMKDALVAASKEASFAAGREESRLVAELKAENLLKSNQEASLKSSQ